MLWKAVAWGGLAWRGGGLYVMCVYESLNLSADSKLKTEWHPSHTHMNSLTVLFSILLFVLYFESVKVLVLYRGLYRCQKRMIRVLISVVTYRMVHMVQNSSWHSCIDSQHFHCCYMQSGTWCEVRLSCTGDLDKYTWGYMSWRF